MLKNMHGVYRQCAPVRFLHVRMVIYHAVMRAHNVAHLKRMCVFLVNLAFSSMASVNETLGRLHIARPDSFHDWTHLLINRRAVEVTPRIITPVQNPVGHGCDEIL